MVTWEVPCPSIGPKDVDRSYKVIIRVSSQSGKGSVTYIMKTGHSMNLPHSTQVEFSSVVQAITDVGGGKANSKAIWGIFANEYLDREAPFEQIALIVDAAQSESNATKIKAHIVHKGREQIVESVDSSPLATYANTLKKFDINVEVQEYIQHVYTIGDDAEAAAHVLADVNSIKVWGSDVVDSTACTSLKAVTGTVNRTLA